MFVDVEDGVGPLPGERAVVAPAGDVEVDIP
jgi:hypothetical protein